MPNKAIQNWTFSTDLLVPDHLLVSFFLFDVQSPIETLVSTLLSTPQLVSTPNCFLSNKICAFLFSRRVEATALQPFGPFWPQARAFSKECHPREQRANERTGVGERSACVVLPGESLGYPPTRCRCLLIGCWRNVMIIAGRRDIPDASKCLYIYPFLSPC